MADQRFQRNGRLGRSECALCGSAGTAAGGERLHQEVARHDTHPHHDDRPWHHGCLDEMFGALLEGRRAETDCRDNIWSMAMVLGAMESSRSGQKVDLTTLVNGL